MKNVKHSKIKNPGVLYELLVRQITTDTFNSDKPSPALSLLKKYFNPKTELGKELQLYRSFFDAPRLNENRAIQFIEVVTKQRKKIDNKTLAKEKYNLVKEIKENYSGDFFTIKIPFYKTYASIYKTFLSETVGSFTNIQEVASSRFALIEHLAKDKKRVMKDELSEDISEYMTQSEDLRLLTYKLMLDKYNEKYDTLNSNQKTLLREYINDVAGSNTFHNYIQHELTTLVSEFDKCSNREKNTTLKIKLKEVSSQLEKMRNNKIRDNDLAAILVSYQLIDELKK